MKKIALSLFVVTTITLGFASVAKAGNCDHSWQTASDGSNCGNRAADVRPGGRP